MDRDGFVALGGKDLVPLEPLQVGFGFDDGDDDAVTVQMRDPFAMTPPGVAREQAPPPMFDPSEGPPTDEELAAGTLPGTSPVPVRTGAVAHPGPAPTRRPAWLLRGAVALALVGVCLLAGYYLNA